MEKREKNCIYITLRSDLCVSSGHSYAGIIDTDVCFDSNGVPYIPAKRIKGVMRIAAEQIMQSADIERIFGKGGIESDEGIIIDDAIMVYDNKNVTDIIKPDGKSITVQDVLGLFTSIRAQTEINENGVANYNTLRYLRVVNQHMPSCVDREHGEVVFKAIIEYCSKDRGSLINVAKSLRHIGMDRNRGLGNVRCKIDKDLGKELEDIKNSLNADGQCTDKVVINYTIRNKGQLMLSSSKDAISEKYISGQMVLGALAGAYMRSKGLNEPDDVFNDIFLSGNSIFSNLYITDDVKRQYSPAPLFINKLKKTKEYVCLLKIYDSKCNSKNYDPSDGNQPKKLQGKYIIQAGIKIRVLEPKVNIIYHHSKNEAYEEARMGDDPKGILYSMEVLEKDQLFSGSIIVEKRYENIIWELLNKTDLRFGKSKSAQYGKCELADADDNSSKLKKLDMPATPGKVMVVFDSDAIIPGEYGYTTHFEDVQNYIADKLGFDRLDNARVYMSTKTVTGYNTKINLKKASVPAVAAGSAFEFEYKGKNKIIDEYAQFGFLGCFISEGYGKIHIVKIDSTGYALTECEEKDADKLIVPKNVEKKITQKKSLENIKAEFIKNAVKNNKFNVSASLIGRLTLMLEESKNSEKPEKDFAKRVVSIKRYSERNKIIDQLKEWNIMQINTCKSEKGDALFESVKIILNDKKQIDNSLWAEYLAFILLHMRYMKKSEKKAKNQIQVADNN